MRLWDRSVWYLCLPRIDSACVTALMTISSCSASLLARCVRLVATWRSSREVDSVHWTPYKMKPDCRIFTFLILSFTLFQDTQGKFIRNSNTFDKILFFYFRLLILNGEFHFNFLAYTHFNKKLFVHICIFCLIESTFQCMSKREENRLFLFGVSNDDHLCMIAIHIWLNSKSFPMNYWYLHVLITPRYGHSKASIELY